MRHTNEVPRSSLPLHTAVKVTAPVLSAAQVTRCRLLAALDSASDDTVILLNAPAGSGKTQLLAEWATTQPGPTAWFTIDHGDNDENRFWSGLLSAFQKCAAPASVAPSSTGVAGIENHLDVAYLAAIADAIQLTPAPVTLILDDIHELTDPRPLRGLRDLITATPQIRLVLAGRVDPGLRLERLGLVERLLVLRGPELAFTLEEVGLLLANAGLDLSVDQVHQLLDQTDGWAAGVRMAATAMRQAEPSAVLADLVGTTRPISDYLVGEVLSGLSVEARRLLDRTAICTQITTPLARALSGLTKAGDILAELESTNSMVTNFGQGRLWFQVHPLLRAHLLMNLRRFRPEMEADLHRTAAAWFEAHAQYDLALAHSMATTDPADTRDLLGRQGLWMLMTGDHSVLCSASDRFPNLHASDPQLALVLAGAHLELGSSETAQRLTAAAALHWPERPELELVHLWELLNGQLRLLGHRQIPCDNHKTPSNFDKPCTFYDDHPSAPLILLSKATYAAAEGHAESCRQLAEEIERLGRRSGNKFLAARGTSLLTLAAALTGDLANVSTLSARAIAAPDHGVGRGTRDAMVMNIFQAQSYLANGLPQQCRELLTPLLQEPASEGNSTFVDEPTSWIHLLHATADHDLGNRASALERLASLHGNLNVSRVTPALAAAHAFIEHDAALQMKHTRQANETFAWAESAIGESPELRLMRARQSTSISRWQSARTQLEPLLSDKITPLVPPTIIEAWVLDAYVRLHTGQRERAIDSLSNALERAGSLATLRPLLRAPADVLVLLTQQLGSWGASESTAQTILVRRQTAAQLSVSLTYREQQVLKLLQSMRSLDEIATDLTVSPNTVKTHVRSIYSKLGVASRRQAVAAAHREGLL